MASAIFSIKHTPVQFASILLRFYASRTVVCRGFVLQHGVEVHTQASGRRLKKKKKKNKYYLFLLCAYFYTPYSEDDVTMFIYVPRAHCLHPLFGAFSPCKESMTPCPPADGVQCFSTPQVIKMPFSATFSTSSHLLGFFLIPTTLLQLLTGL